MFGPKGQIYPEYIDLWKYPSWSHCVISLLVVVLFAIFRPCQIFQTIWGGHWKIEVPCLWETLTAAQVMFAICIRRAVWRTCNHNGLPSHSHLCMSTAISSSKIKQEPPTARIGATKLLLVMGPCIYFGGRLGKLIAEALEEWSIFSPDDDDDEDDWSRWLQLWTFSADERQEDLCLIFEKLILIP